jgi:hypothetical protein
MERNETRRGGWKEETGVMQVEIGGTMLEEKSSGVEALKKND